MNNRSLTGAVSFERVQAALYMTKYLWIYVNHISLRSNSLIRIYTRTPMAQTPLEPWKYVQDGVVQVKEC